MSNHSRRRKQAARHQALYLDAATASVNAATVISRIGERTAEVEVATRHFCSHIYFPMNVSPEEIQARNLSWLSRRPRNFRHHPILPTPDLTESPATQGDGAKERGGGDVEKDGEAGGVQ